MQRYSHVFIITAIIIASMGCSSGLELPSEGDNINIATVNPLRGVKSAVTEGAEIYRIKCSQCHGEKADGGAGPDLTDTESVYGVLDDEVFRITYFGTPNGMPTWRYDLGEEGIWKVLAYIEELKKGNSQ